MEAQDQSAAGVLNVVAEEVCTGASCFLLVACLTLPEPTCRQRLRMLLADGTR